MFEQVTIVGNLGRDPEMRFTKGGSPMTFFSVATSNKYTRKDGVKVEETTWWNVTVFGPQAESCNQYLEKGNPVLVIGRMNSGPDGNPKVFERKDGTYGASYDLTAQNVRFLPSGGGPNSGGGGSSFNDDEAPF